MTDTSPDPKPLTDDELTAFITNPTLIFYTTKSHVVGEFLKKVAATITTLRASLGEAEKRAEEAKRVNAQEVSDRMLAIDRKAEVELHAKIANLTTTLSASEGLVAVLREALKPFADAVTIDEGDWSIVTAGPTDDDWKRAFDLVSDNPLADRSTTPATRTLGRTPWQPIDTAPKDGTWVIVTNDTGGAVVWLGRYIPVANREPDMPQHEGWWNCSRWKDGDRRGMTPSHWMSVPTPPEAITRRAAAGEGT